MKPITVIGSINMDIVSQVGCHPKPGETVIGKDFAYIPGGKGANQAIAAARAGGSVSLFGKIGNDAFGVTLKEFLAKESLNLAGLLVAQGVPTGAAFVAVASGGENVIYVSGGANSALTIRDAEGLDTAEGSIVSATLETPYEVTQHIFERAKVRGATTVLNAAPVVLAAKSLFAYTDYLIINEHELASFAGVDVSGDIDGAVRGMKELRESYSSMTVITTLGSKGSVALVGDSEAIRIAGLKVKVVDTTAAGDCFVGCFVVALSGGRDVKAAMEFANRAAALSVQKLGASSSLPRREEIS